MKNKVICAILALVLLCSLASCRRVEPVNEKPSIVATNFAMFDFARAVAGDAADVMMLIPPGSESHDFEVRLADMTAISNADLFVCVGGESEIGWVNAALTSIIDPPETIAAIQLVQTYEEETVEGMAPSDEDEDGDETAADEHCWTSFENAVRIIEEIAERLEDKFPEHAGTFRTNAENYIAELNGLKEEYRSLVDSAVRNTIVVADRFPFRYLAEEFDLEYHAAFSGCASATEPPLSTVNFLIEKIREEEIPVIFTIEFSDGNTARAIAAETGCEILTLHSAHNVSKEDYRAGVTYADIMRQNLEALREALN